MSKRNIMLIAIIVAGLIGFLTVGAPPVEIGEPVAQLVAGPPPKPVSDEELDIYLVVYKAMQSDRNLMIDAALVPHAMSLEDFRDIERRIQMRTTLVDRVRRELLAHAEEISIFEPGTPTETETAAP